jgi:ribosomal protein S18 acetylase RimI-like enzyme
MLRRATADDGPEIAALFRRSFGTLTFLPTLHTPEEDRAHFGRIVAEQEVWVSEDDGRILGFASLTDDELTNLYVEPDAHGRGVGTALLDRAKEQRPAGFRFWVFQQNERARRFYERHGAVAIRFTEGSDNEERQPDALYEWRPTAK